MKQLRKQTPKRRGRPPTGRGENLTIRLRSDLLATLRQAAQRNGRSLSKEVSQCLDVNFAPVGQIGSWRGPHVTGLVRLVKEITERIEMMLGGGNWREDRYIHEALRTALEIILSELAPEGDPAIPEVVQHGIKALNERDLHFKDEWTDPKAAGASIGFGFWQQLTTALHFEAEHSTLRIIADELGLSASGGTQR
jgi:hypothetical protein